MVFPLEDPIYSATLKTRRAFRKGRRYSRVVSDLAQSLGALVSARVPGLIALYLFGSRARGDGGQDADFDLGLLGRGKLDSVERWKLQEDLAALVHTHVDLVDLRQASTVMRVQVLRDAVLMVDASPPERQAFEVVALSAYARLNEERREILNDIGERGRVYG
jgi:predicted nucleotidyltransferase